MIFVFAEDSSLEIIESLEEARQNYEGIDVESGVFQFFDETGKYLKPQFTKPNKTGRFLGIFNWVESGEFELVPSQETDEDIYTYLAETSVLEPNPWFSDLEAVRQYLTKTQADSFG